MGFLIFFYFFSSNAEVKWRWVFGVGLFGRLAGGRNGFGGFDSSEQLLRVVVFV